MQGLSDMQTIVCLCMCVYLNVSHLNGESGIRNWLLLIKSPWDGNAQINIGSDLMPDCYLLHFLVCLHWMAYCH